MGTEVEVECFIEEVTEGEEEEEEGSYEVFSQNIWFGS